MTRISVVAILCLCAVRGFAQLSLEQAQQLLTGDSVYRQWRVDGKPVSYNPSDCSEYLVFYREDHKALLKQCDRDCKCLVTVHEWHLGRLDKYKKDLALFLNDRTYRIRITSDTRRGCCTLRLFRYSGKVLNEQKYISP